MASPKQPQQPVTAEGTLVGTFQYMAPEQIEGKDADARSDIFAFGAMLYEIVTGRDIHGDYADRATLTTASAQAYRKSKA